MSIRVTIRGVCAATGRWLHCMHVVSQIILDGKTKELNNRRQLRLKNLGHMQDAEARVWCCGPRRNGPPRQLIRVSGRLVYFNANDTTTRS